MPDYNLSPKEAADLLGIHEDTLKRAADQGKLPYWRTPGGWRRFSREDVEAFGKAHDAGRVA